MNDKKLIQENERLKKEIEALKDEKEDLEMMMEMASDHADGLGDDLLAKVQASEERFRLITETIPVPMIITHMSDGKIIYANEPSESLFALPRKLLIGKKTTDFYEPHERERLIKGVMEHGYLKHEELQGRDASGKPFWTELSVRPIAFDRQDCLLSIWHDVTNRKKAEEEIRRLNEELSRQEKEQKKFVIFTLDDDKYGFEISCVREIVEMVPVTPVPNAPDAVKGVINLRGRVFQLTDIRLKLGLKETVHTDRTCIIVVDIGGENGENPVGVIVDSVSEVLSVFGRDIRDIPSFGIQINTDFISGMVEIRGELIMLIKTNMLFEKAFETTARPY